MTKGAMAKPIEPPKVWIEKARPSRFSFTVLERIE